MKIALIGTVMHDEIITVEGERIESFGGVLYNLLALSVVAQPQDRLLPMAYLSWDHLEQLRGSILADVTVLDASALRVNATGTDSNTLRYRTTSSREENLRIVTPPLDLELLEKTLRDCDAVLVNLISGQELSLAAFAQLRTFCKGPIYLDVHNLGRTEAMRSGGRFDGWRPWVAAADIVQLNEWEAERLFGHRPQKEDEYRRALEEVLSVEGPRIAVITLGEEGCAVAIRLEGGIQHLRIPALETLQIRDTTGCGDCFSAGFLLEYLRSGDPNRAAIFATTLSGLNCAQTGLQGVRQITDVAHVMESNYGKLLGGTPL